MSPEILLAEWESVLERKCRIEVQTPPAAQSPSPGGPHSFTSVPVQKDVCTDAHIVNKNIPYADLPHRRWEKQSHAFQCNRSRAILTGISAFVEGKLQAWNRTLFPKHLCINRYALLNNLYRNILINMTSIYPHTQT